MIKHWSYARFASGEATIGDNSQGELQTLEEQVMNGNIAHEASLLKKTETWTWYGNFWIRVEEGSDEIYELKVLDEIRRGQTMRSMNNFDSKGINANKVNWQTDKINT